MFGLHLLVVAGVRPVLVPNGSDTGSRRAIRLSTVLHLLKVMFAGLWLRVTQVYSMSVGRVIRPIGESISDFLLGHLPIILSHGRMAPKQSFSQRKIQKD
jgi:hypothetical protein